jgi:hypothetical protein
MEYEYKAEQKNRQDLPVHEWRSYFKNNRKDGWVFHDVKILNEHPKITYIFIFKKKIEHEIKRDNCMHTFSSKTHMCIHCGLSLEDYMCDNCHLNDSIRLDK